MILSKLGVTNPELVEVEDPLSQDIASDFVQRVMAATPLLPVENIDIDTSRNERQIITTKAIVHTNNKQTPRKKQLSDEDSGVEVCKKIRSENENDPPFIDSSKDNVLIQMMSQLSSNLDSMGARLERRISDIESNVERKLTAKCNTVIMERVKEEVNKVKEEIHTEIDDLKENFKRLDKTYAEIVSKEKTIENVDSNRTKALNIVIKNIPSDPREISNNTVLKTKIETLVKDGLKLKDVNIKNVTRSTRSQNNHTEKAGKPGIVFVELDNLDHKRQILKSKRSLKDSSKYTNVYIENYIPREKRMVDFNNRALLKAMGRDKDYKTIDGRITRKQEGPNEPYNADEDIHRIKLCITRKVITTDHNLLHVGQQGVTDADVDVDNTAEEDISTNAGFGI